MDCIKMKTLLSSAALVALSALSVLCVRNCRMRSRTLLDVSTWSEDNIQALENIGQTIKSLKVPWPDFDETPRRRLIEDRWAKEERDMKSEVAEYFRDNASIKSSQHNMEPASLRGNEVMRKRNEQGLPPVSSNCTNPSSTTLPCPEEDLPQVCDKYRNGNFEQCFQRCKKSFCCTHDSSSNVVAKSCVNEDNCRNYIPCYIVWWKLSDTVGPAPFLRLPNSPDFLDFYNIDTAEVYLDKQKADAVSQNNFYVEYFNHYTNDDVALDDAYFEVKESWKIVQDGGKPITPDSPNQ